MEYSCSIPGYVLFAPKLRCDKEEKSDSVERLRNYLIIQAHTEVFLILLYPFVPKIQNWVI